MFGLLLLRGFLRGGCGVSSGRKKKKLFLGTNHLPKVDILFFDGINGGFAYLASALRLCFSYISLKLPVGPFGILLELFWIFGW